MAENIEREALLHDIEQSVVYTAKEKITSAEMRGAHKIIERIKCAPAVDVAPVVHGQWIIGVDDDNFDVKCPKWDGLISLKSPESPLWKESLKPCIIA